MGTSTPASVCTKLERIAELARRAPAMPMRTLAHHIDVEWLVEAYRRTRKDGAVGVDGQTAEQYGKALEQNLESLLDRVKAGRYRAPPVRRVYIPKANGREMRPLGIPAFEDKVLQRAVVMVLEAVYEQDFLSCSYGFRPGRSAHDALDDLRDQLMEMRGGWVLEIDFRNYFGSIDHGHLQEALRQRITDGSLLRLISKWLHAGVMENGALSYPTSGTPQGGVVSPMLANVFLHVVLDTWFEQDVKPRLNGQARLIRYADDAVLVFANESDARRVLEVLPKRCEKYGLTLHPTKTKLIEFRKPDRAPPRGNPPGDDGPKGNSTFDLLGFTHYWELSRPGRWVIKRKTARDRLRAAIKRVKAWCRRHLHDPVREQWRKLSQKLRGHYAYYGIAYNSKALGRFEYHVCIAWWRALRRRSQRPMPWIKMARLLKIFRLPQPRIVRPLRRSLAKP
jgi:group II intron reverse transcriptase/maturase